MGPRPYDLSAYSGITFFAMAAPGTAPLRVKLPMRATTRIQDGGTCDESVLGRKCSDDWGEQFNLPSNGTWKQFRAVLGREVPQEGWGPVFPWNPATSRAFRSSPSTKSRVMISGSTTSTFCPSPR